MPKPKPQPPKSIRFSEAQAKYIAILAKAQGHYNFSEAVKRLVNREMEAGR